MICIKTEIPQEICDIDDELKAIYHSKDTVCIWVFKTRIDRNKFMDELLECLKMIEKCILNLFIKFDDTIKLEKHLISIKKNNVKLTYNQYSLRIESSL